ncbi:FAD-binding protein [Actinoalloteichus hymeniacidonis]|nr:FAD-binding protein [Actinoalloteichus hymeniacidonis]MBB5908463.1 xylitol oxidase [Actinoalloteichus hymeniacidonis]
MTTMRTNWAGNVTFGAERIVSPDSLDGLREVVTASRRVRVVGAGHSFSRIADTEGTLLSLDELPEILEIGSDTIRVGAGLRLGRVAAYLHEYGLALPTLPSLPHITVAGACATATHGSGDAHGSLADAVVALDLVLADGSLRTLRRGEPGFDGAVVSLGALGIVTSMELRCTPTFDVEQRVYQGVPLAVLADDFDGVYSESFSVSTFTTFDDTADVLVKHRVGDQPVDLGWTGAREATAPRHPIVGQPVQHCTPQLGETGPWHERLPHFRADFAPSVGAELQSEYFVARQEAGAALRAVAALRADLAPVLLTGEIRTVAADEQWLSPTYRRSSVVFHFTWRPDTPAVLDVLTRLEQSLAPWSFRPHWGKLFVLPPEELRGRYPEFDRFRSLRREFDPHGRFRNETIDTWFADL